MSAQPDKPAHALTASPRGRLATVFTVALLLAASTTPIFAAADLPGGSHGTLAAVFAPGTDRTAALAAVVEAGGSVVRTGGWAAVLVAHSDEPGFAERLRRAGAWLVVDPRSAAGCLLASDV